MQHTRLDHIALYRSVHTISLPTVPSVPTTLLGSKIPCGSLLYPYDTTQLSTSYHVPYAILSTPRQDRIDCSKGTVFSIVRQTMWFCFILHYALFYHTLYHMTLHYSSLLHQTIPYSLSHCLLYYTMTPVLRTL